MTGIIKSDSPTVTEKAITAVILVMVTLNCTQIASDLPFYRFETSQTNSLNSFISLLTQIWILLGSFHIFLTSKHRFREKHPGPRSVMFILDCYLVTVTVFAGSQIFQYLPALLLFYVLSRLQTTPEYVVGLLSRVCALVLVCSLVLLLVKPSYAIMKVNIERFSIFGGQLAGLTPHPNTLGLFAGIGLGLALLFEGQSRALRLSLFLISLVMIIGSGSRLAYWIGGLAFLVYLSRRSGASLSKRINVLIVVTASTAAIFALIDGASSLIEILNGRDKIWSDYISYWQIHPLFGGGFDSGKEILIVGVNAVTSLNGGQSHNEYLGDLVKGGLIGLSLVLLFMLLTYRKLRREDYLNNPKILFLALAFVSVSFVEQLLTFTIGSRFIFTIILSLIASLSNRNQGEAIPDKHLRIYR